MLFANIDDTLVRTIISNIENMDIDNISDSDIQSNGIYLTTNIRDILKQAKTFLTVERRVITEITKGEDEINVSFTILD